METSKQQLESNTCNPEEEIEEGEEEKEEDTTPAEPEKPEFDNPIYEGTSSDADSPFRDNYRNLQANRCYCNNDGSGVSLINSSLLALIMQYLTL